MNRALQWKLIAGFVLVFVAGAMTGALLAVSQARHFFFENHAPALVAARMKERLRAELSLTPDQINKISPLVDKMAGQLEQIRMETGRRVHETFMESHREMAAILTDEQRHKLQQLEARHHQWHAFHGPPPPPGMSPP